MFGIASGQSQTKLMTSGRENSKSQVFCYVELFGLEGLVRQLSLDLITFLYKTDFLERILTILHIHFWSGNCNAFTTMQDFLQNVLSPGSKGNGAQGSPQLKKCFKLKLGFLREAGGGGLITFCDIFSSCLASPSRGRWGEKSLSVLNIWTDAAYHANALLRLDQKRNTERAVLVKMISLPPHTHPRSPVIKKHLKPP